MSTQTAPSDEAGGAPIDVDAYAAAVPLRRIGDPEDIGGIGAFLASDAALFITGQVISPNGGLVM